MLRPCRICGDLIESHLYDRHRQQHKNDEKGSPRKRGYDAEHDRLRREWAPLVERGVVDCARCGEAIVPGSSWQLDHDENDPTKATYLGPSHSGCNQGAR